MLDLWRNPTPLTPPRVVHRSQGESSSAVWWPAQGTSRTWPVAPNKMKHRAGRGREPRERKWVGKSMSPWGDQKSVSRVRRGDSWLAFCASPCSLRKASLLVDILVIMWHLNDDDAAMGPKAGSSSRATTNKQAGHKGVGSSNTICSKS